MTTGPPTRGALLAAALMMLPASPGAEPSPTLPPGHYAGAATATWSITSSPSWLRSLALKAIELREGIDDIPAVGRCGGVVGLDVGDDGAITGAARCEFTGDLARYNDRVASLVATEVGSGLVGTAGFCGIERTVPWTATRTDAGLTGQASGSAEATAVSVETPLGTVEVSLRVDWSVSFHAARVE